MITDPAFAARFHAKVDRSGGPDACHIWRAGRSYKGYGKFAIARDRSVPAHRVAFFIAHGRWPEPLCCHRCDNPSCVNPDHLFEGTVAENNSDKAAKHRAIHGERHHNVTLTDRMVLDIRANAALCRVTQGELARRFGVSQSTIWRIVHRKTRAILSQGPAR